MWLKVDDRFWSHPKVLHAITLGGNAAVGVWIRAASYAAGQGPGGLVPPGLPGTLGARPREVRALVESGLWEPLEDGAGWRFHDWHDRNPSELVERRRFAGALGNHVRHHANRGRLEPGCRWCDEEVEQHLAEDRDRVNGSTP